MSPRVDIQLAHLAGTEVAFYNEDGLQSGADKYLMGLATHYRDLCELFPDMTVYTTARRLRVGSPVVWGKVYIDYTPHDMALALAQLAQFLLTEPLIHAADVYYEPGVHLHLGVWVTTPLSRQGDVIAWWRRLWAAVQV